MDSSAEFGIIALFVFCSSASRRYFQSAFHFSSSFPVGYSGIDTVLRLGKEQWDVARRSERAGFLRRAKLNLAANFPGCCDDLDHNQFSLFIDRCEEIAHDHRLFSEQAILTVSHLVLLLGPSFQTMDYSKTVSDVLQSTDLQEPERLSSALLIGHILHADLEIAN